MLCVWLPWRLGRIPADSQLTLGLGLTGNEALVEVEI